MNPIKVLKFRFFSTSSIGLVPPFHCEIIGEVKNARGWIFKYRVEDFEDARVFVRAPYGTRYVWIDYESGALLGMVEDQYRSVAGGLFEILKEVTSKPNEFLNQTDAWIGVLTYLKSLPILNVGYPALLQKMRQKGISKNIIERFENVR